MTQYSRYLQITPWLLLEYTYSKEPISGQLVPYWKIRNEHTNTWSFINGNIGREKTGNVLERSVAAVDTNNIKWGYLNSNSVIPLYTVDGSGQNGIDTKIILDKNTNVAGGDIQYDTVKLHLVAGFNIDNLDGIITNIKIDKWAGGTFDLLNHIWRRGDEWIEFNPNPLWLGDRLYDRFIQIKVPSLSWIKTLSLQSTDSFLNEYINDPRGVKNDGLIKVSIYEIDSTERKNDILYFNTGNKYTTSFLSDDQFVNLRAVLRENEGSDYFEYFAAWGDDIIQNYISELNQNGNWVVAHNIRVVEQIGVNRKTTTNYTSLQDADFGLPNIFRPIVINADIAFSFSIDYTMRLFNTENGEQVIRTVSITSNQPKKYGQNLEKIGVNEGYRPVKIYNKIVNNDNTTLFNIQTQNNEVDRGRFLPINEVKFRTEYVPVYFNNYNVSIKANNSPNDTTQMEMILGQGNTTIFLTPFDNHISFNIFDNVGEEYQELEIDHNKLYLSFVLDDGTKLWVKSDRNNIDKNQIDFIVTSEISRKILVQKTKKFYIVSKDIAESLESVMYWGVFAKMSERESVMKKINDEKEKGVNKKLEKVKKMEENIKKREEKLKQDQSKLSSSTKIKNTSITQPTSPVMIQNTGNTNTSRESIQLDSTVNNRVLEKHTQKVIEKLSNVKDIRDIKFTIKDLPGESIDMSTNIRSIKPISVTKKSERADKYTETKI